VSDRLADLVAAGHDLALRIDRVGDAQTLEQAREIDPARAGLGMAIDFASMSAALERLAVVMSAAPRPRGSRCRCRRGR